MSDYRAVGSIGFELSSCRIIGPSEYIMWSRSRKHQLGATLSAVIPRKLPISVAFYDAHVLRVIIYYVSQFCVGLVYVFYCLDTTSITLSVAYLDRERRGGGHKHRCTLVSPTFYSGDGGTCPLTPFQLRSCLLLHYHLSQRA